ncbi:MAG: EpsG family protein [Clostridia bacterium]|nr:EpsG family protein [Clostridia bacterium]
MIVYWSLFAITLFLASFVRDKQSKKLSLCVRGIQNYSFTAKHIFLILIPMLFFFGLRSKVGDTAGYIYSFENLTTEFSLVGLDDRAYGFSILQRICKSFLFKHPNMWIALLTIISVIPITYILSKYSTDVRLSLFVFIASTEFTFLINGARQFVAVCICFYAFKFLVEKKPVMYYLLVLLAISFHLTAIVMLFAYFLVRSKPWSVKMWIIIICAALACVFSESVFGFMNDAFLEDGVYGHYAEDVMNTRGVNILRVAVAFVPVILAFYSRKRIEAQNCEYINYCINLSVLNAMCFLFASTMGANLTGRIAEYFTIYNLILYPYLFTHALPKKEGSVIKVLFYIAFLIFFIYQMQIAWGGLEYVSEVLGIDC